MTRAVVAVVALLAVVPLAARAQGTLSAQGFGYPAGELSSRSYATGGGTAPVDPMSTVNDASIGGGGRTGLYFQWAPEWRTVQTSTGSDASTVIRFPVLGLSFNASRRLTIGLSATTFLDRSWQTTLGGLDTLSTGDTVRFGESFRSTGSIVDVRLATAFQVFKSLRFGIGGHVLTGQNRMQISRAMVDSISVPYQQATTYSYTGSMVSAGLIWAPLRMADLSVYGRLGGTMKSYIVDSTQTTGKAPKVLGGGIEISPLAGILLAARAEWTGWSSMQTLGTLGGFSAHDSWDYGGGLEVRGPGILGADIPLRVGYRHRTLPFAADAGVVTENTISFGFGFVLARGRSRIDLSGGHANRSSPTTPVTESAWTASMGVSLHP